MFQRLLTSGLFAGFAAGLIAGALQFVFVQPVLLHAELYESGQLTHFGAGAQPGVAALLPPVDWTRSGLTVLFTALLYTGYALLLVAGFALAETRGARIDARAGALWGLAGFVAFHLAPAAGLPPELPGMAAADIRARQLWWLFCLVATGAGLWLLLLERLRAGWIIGVALLAAPHLVGAPHPEAFSGPAPPELASLFAGRTLAVGLASWVVLGLLAGHFWVREQAAGTEAPA
ncbi:cobalt transporter [Rhodobacteraceae bacterium 2CG4]|uniref:Cobalt transporter n=1 Tax=Halovulum marinum TaxID=2662447 RepID=A0A6L5Z1S7_9RHOB|nr:CbtA family protein [Halovulum marinum]MSU90458.1 cobalt transporter [Halovulum marinum]